MTASPSIILPRQTQRNLVTASGALASGDQIGEIIVSTTGIYLCGFDTWGATAIAAPRSMELLVERQLPVPLQSFSLALAGVSTAGEGAKYRGRVILRGQVPDSLGGFSEQWSYLVRLRTALPVGESVQALLTLTLLATILESPQETIEQVKLDTIDKLKLAL